MSAGTILVCDDHADLLSLVELYLRRAGYDILIADNGEEALKLALRNEPDLVLLDINMPLLNGYEVAEKLRNKGFDAPIVALTGCAVEASETENMTVILRKPIRLKHLVSEIRELIP